MNLEIPFTPAEEARLSEAARQSGIAPAEFVRRLALRYLVPESTHAEDDMDSKLSAWKEKESTGVSSEEAARQLFARWAEEDARMTPDEEAQNERIYAEIEKNGIPRVRI